MQRTLRLLSVVACLVLAGSFASAQEEEGKATVERVLNAKDAGELSESVAQLMSKASKEQLQEYKRHTHSTIALHAAWEEVKRGVRGIDPKSREEDKTIVNIDRPALQRFLGFVEGRLHVTPPEWWQKIVARAKIDSEVRHNLSLIYATNRKFNPYFHLRGSVHHLTTFEVIPVEDGGYELKSDKFTCTISPQLLEQIKKINPRDVDLPGLTAWMNAERCVFGFHWFLSSEFTLHCIERKSGKLLWSTDVWGYFWGGFGGGGFLHWAEMRIDGDTIYLFGIDATGIIYIEAFSMKDGKNQFHFTTNYVADP